VEVKFITACIEKPLAVCRGSFWPRDAFVQIHWLGRLDTVPGAAEDTQWKWLELDAYSEPSQSSGTRRTIAEVALGLVAGIAEQFGMTYASLEAEDKGSGRLVQYYEKRGFVLTGRTEGKDPTMQAPIAAVSKLATTAWVQSALEVVPDIWAWLDCNIKHHWLVRENREWSWSLPFPIGATLETSLKPYCDGGTRCNMVAVEAAIIGRGKVEFAFIKCALRPRQKTLRIMWLGCSRSRPVHENVRGKKQFLVEPSGEMITAAVALLGTVCVLGRWIGTETVELLVFDKGSGALLHYLSSFGFTETALEGHKAGEPAPMKASCEVVASRCCPTDWKVHLPPDLEAATAARIMSFEEEIPP
jgi:hypothetical protein